MLVLYVSIIIPVLKDKSGDLSSRDNYSPVFSKLVELVLIDNRQPLLSTI